MIEILLAATITCSEGAWILEGVADTEISSEAKNDLVIEIIRAMPDNCTYDEYNGVLQ